MNFKRKSWKATMAKDHQSNHLEKGLSTCTSTIGICGIDGIKKFGSETTWCPLTITGDETTKSFW